MIRWLSEEIFDVTPVESFSASDPGVLDIRA
jgi:hypothetical protein